MRRLWRYVAWAIAATTLSVLLLSAAGMYALMSCTVAPRTREIATSFIMERLHRFDF